MAIPTDLEECIYEIQDAVKSRMQRNLYNVIVFIFFPFVI